MVGLLSNKIQRDELKPGDHIYSWRHSYLYAHHGIYVGDGNVIHFTRGAGQEVGFGTVLDRIIFSSSPSNPADTPCPRCGDQSKAEGVISSCLECFLSDGELYLFQYGVSPAVYLVKARGGTCTLARSDPPDDVLHRAKYLLQNGFGGYNIFKNNCEDFTVYCKTGLLVFTTVSVGRSGQAASFLAATSAIVSSPLRFMTSGFAGLTAVGCGIYCICRIVTDIGMRRDVMKVPVERLVCCGTIEDTIADVPTPKDKEIEADVQIHTPKEEEVAAAVHIQTLREEEREADVHIQTPKKEEREAGVQTKTPKGKESGEDVQTPREEEREADVHIQTPKKEEREADVHIKTPKKEEREADVQIKTPKEGESEAEVETPKEKECSRHS